MATTFEEPRPTVVSVIGWAWVILGGMMLLSATLGLVMHFATPKPEIPDDVPFAAFWRYVVVFAVGQVLLSVFGIVAGLRFLKLEKWARGALEIASWILLTALLGFVVFWVLNVSAIVGEDAAAMGFEAFYMAVGVISTLFYGTPVGLMIYHLRSDRVRQAMR